MTFQESVRTCLTEKYAAFAGRASRSEYWWFILAYVIIMVIAGLIWWIVQVLAVLALIVPVTAAGWRRLQDTGKPGWYILIPVGLGMVFSIFRPGVPTMGPDGMPAEMPSMVGMLFGGLLGLIQLVIALLFLWWLTRPSQPGTNEYGPNPHEVTP